MPGRLNGACKLIEEGLGRDLCYLPCRHHIYELLLKAVFETSWPTTTGPNVSIFKRFQDHWPEIDPTQFEIGIEDSLAKEALTEAKPSILEFIRRQFMVISMGLFNSFFSA